jgi:hypothetical protein
MEKTPDFDRHENENGRSKMDLDSNTRREGRRSNRRVLRYVIDKRRYRCCDTVVLWLP